MTTKNGPAADGTHAAHGAAESTRAMTPANGSDHPELAAMGAEDNASMDHAAMGHEGMDHAAMGHGESAATPMQHEAMDHAVHGRDVDGGHDAHMDHTGHETMFRDRFWLSLALTLPVLLFSPMLQRWFGFTMPTFPGSAWIGSLFSIVIFYYGGLPFLRMAAVELRNRQPGMMTLISMAITVAFVYSMIALVLPSAEGFFWELVTLIDVMLLGHWIEMRSVRQASSSLDELARLMPDEAERIGADGQVEVVPVSALSTGDLLLVRPGAGVPADGEVVEGSSEVNEGMITGESRAVEKETGMSVIAGTINGDGSLRIRVAATGESTALAGIMRLVKEAQASKSRTQVLADRAAAWLFYIALASAALTAVGWVVASGWDLEVVERVVTVLVIACPHALGLAVPLVVAITTSLGARNGLLVRDRRALEQARQIDIVLFDKTGTLTEGKQGVVALRTASGGDESEMLALLAAAEGDSEHPIAKAIRDEAARRGLELPAVESFEAIKGRGILAGIGGREVHVGGPRLLEMLALTPPDDLATFEREQGAQGRAVIHLIVDGRIAGAIALADRIRDESRSAIARLHEMGVEVAMITGDSEDVARSVATELNIDRYFAQVLPEHKDRKVAELQKQGLKVAMVGDGVNDAPALTRADVGIAIGSGTDVAVQSAGIILVKSNPLDVVRIITLSRASYRKMIQNLWWATGYNLFAIPLAAGVLAPIGILLSPAVGAVFMSLSTIIVAINAQLLRNVDLSPEMATA